jgi:hypothetical protein
VASLERMALRPSHELAIPLAGPAVNVAIALALLGMVLPAGIGPQASFRSPSSNSYPVPGEIPCDLGRKQPCWAAS